MVGGDPGGWLSSLQIPSVTEVAASCVPVAVKLEAPFLKLPRTRPLCVHVSACVGVRVSVCECTVCVSHGGGRKASVGLEITN